MKMLSAKQIQEFVPFTIRHRDGQWQASMPNEIDPEEYGPELILATADSLSDVLDKLKEHQQRVTSMLADHLALLAKD